MLLCAKVLFVVMDTFASKDDIKCAIEDVLEEAYNVSTNEYLNNYVRDVVVPLGSTGETFSVTVGNLEEGLNSHFLLEFTYTLPKSEIKSVDSQSRELSERVGETECLDRVKTAINELLDPKSTVGFRLSETSGSSVSFRYDFPLSDMTKIPSDDGYDLEKVYSLELHEEWKRVPQDESGVHNSSNLSIAGDFYIGKSSKDVDVDVGFDDTVSLLGTSFVVQHSEQDGMQLKSEEDGSILSVQGFDDVKKLARSEAADRA
jgi:hypothetical protein